MELKVGMTIQIIEMKDEPSYSGRIGVIRFIDDAKQLHGSWGGLALIPGIDEFKVVEVSEDKNHD